MKKNIQALLFMAIAVILSATTISARKTVSRDTDPGTKTETINAPGKFSSVSLNGTADYELIANTSKTGLIEVKYTLPKGGMEKIVTVNVKNGELIVNGSFKTPKGVKYSDKCKMTIKIYCGPLSGIKSTGTGDVKSATTYNPGVLKVKLDGTGDISLGKVSTKQLTVKLSGTGDLKAKEVSCNGVEVNLNGTGDIEFKGIDSRDVALSNNGTGDIETGALNCDMLRISNSGTGDIDIKGGSASSLEVRNNGTGDTTVKGFEYGNISTTVGVVGSVSVNGKKY